MSLVKATYVGRINDTRVLEFFEEDPMFEEVQGRGFRLSYTEYILDDYRTISELNSFFTYQNSGEMIWCHEKPTKKELELYYAMKKLKNL